MEEKVERKQIGLCGALIVFRFCICAMLICNKYVCFVASRFRGFKVSRSQGFKVSRFQRYHRFQGYKVSRFQGFKVSRVSRFQGFKVSRFHGFKVSKVSRFQGFQVSRFQGPSGGSGSSLRLQKAALRLQGGAAGACARRPFGRVGCTLARVGFTF